MWMIAFIMLVFLFGCQQGEVNVKLASETIDISNIAEEYFGRIPIIVKNMSNDSLVIELIEKDGTFNIQSFQVEFNSCDSIGLFPRGASDFYTIGIDTILPNTSKKLFIYLYPDEVPQKKCSAFFATFGYELLQDYIETPFHNDLRYKQVPIFMDRNGEIHLGNIISGFDGRLSQDSYKKIDVSYFKSKCKDCLVSSEN